MMKLVVGLGNIGRKYEKTRHNVGFEVLERLARRHAVEAAQDRFRGRVSDTVIAGQRVLMLWPHTFMNRSGQCVKEAVDFYRVPLDELLVVCDDFHLPLGKLRFRSSGSAGGQKGLEDIICRLGSECFSRLRVGIGPVPDARDAADYVLTRFSEAERQVIDEAMERAADGVECWIVEGIEAAMNRFNG